MEEIEKLFVGLGLKSTLSDDVAAAEQDLDELEVAAEKAAAKMAAEFEQVGDAAKKIGKDLTLFVTTPLLAAAGASVMFAGEAVEAQGKFNAIFGEGAARATQWAEDFGDAAGRATTDLQDMMSTSMAMVKAMGMSADEGTEFSQTMAQLAVDLGSFHNVADDEVFNALKSAIIGVTLPMRRYGVVLTEDRVEQELLNMGIKGGAKAATDAQKAQARLNIMLRDTADAHGDAERTADSFSNQLKALAADTKELGEKVGRDLLPIALRAVDVVRRFIAGFERLDDSTRKIILVTGGFAAALGPAIWLSGSLIGSIGKIKLAIDAYKVSTFAATLATRGFSAALLTTPAGMVALAVAGLVAGLAVLTWHLGRAEDKAFDLGDAMAYSAKDLRRMADEAENAEHPIVTFFDRISAGGAESESILERLARSWWAQSQAARDAEAEQYRYAATIRDAMDAAEAELRKADRAYSDHQRAVSELSREYDDLRNAIDRAMEMPTAIEDQGRAVEHAQIALERARERQRNLGRDATSLDRREADLAVRDAEARLRDANARMDDLKAEEKEILGGQTIEQAKDRLAGLTIQLDDRTALMEKALKDRNEIQKIHDAIAEKNDEDLNQGYKDRWEALKAYFDQNPIAKKIGLDLDWFSAKTGSVPALASGGIVTRPTLALVGEAGPEAIIPLGGGGDNSTTSLGGDTFFSITINEAANPGGTADEIFRRWEEMQRSKRVQRGVRA